jgi:hypothetical protein
MNDLPTNLPACGTCTTLKGAIYNESTAFARPQHSGYICGLLDRGGGQYIHHETARLVDVNLVDKVQHHEEEYSSLESR